MNHHKCQNLRKALTCQKASDASSSNFLLSPAASAPIMASVHPTATKSKEDTHTSMNPQAQAVEFDKMDCAPIQTEDVHPRKPHSLFELHPQTVDLEDIESWPLSGEKPFFDIVLSKSNVNRSYHLFFPSKMSSVLPSAKVPAIITCHGKIWETKFHGDKQRKRFDISWKTFVIDNKLREGDALVFEITESSNKIIKFAVRILRGDFPPELLAMGESLDNPMIVD